MNDTSHTDQFKQVQRELFSRLINRNSKKYKSFLWFLRFFKYASMDADRGNLLEAYYVFMRYVDDVIDGDAPLPARYTSKVDFLAEKLRFTNTLNNPLDDADQVFLYCQYLQQKTGISLNDETKDILMAMYFDAKRVETATQATQQELDDHYFMLDIRGTIRATLKVFGEDPDKVGFLVPLGRATRIQYDLEDLSSDLQAGIINIPSEDMIKYKLGDRAHSDNGNLDIWTMEKAREGMMLLDEHRIQLPKAGFRLLTRATLKWVYEYPAHKYFKSVLNKTD